MKKKVRPEKYESIHYPLEIVDWNWPYYFSISPDLKPRPGLPELGPFLENKDIYITGRLLAPKTHEGRVVEIRIIGDREIADIIKHPQKCLARPKGLGSLTLRGKTSEGLLFVPFYAIHTLCLLLHAGKLKFLVLTGKPLYRGNADIRGLHFEKEYKPEDWN
jgi:hypothetical protein